MLERRGSWEPRPKARLFLKSGAAGPTRTGILDPQVAVIRVTLRCAVWLGYVEQ